MERAPSSAQSCSAAAADLPTVTRRIAWRALVAADRVAGEALRPESCLWLGRDAHLVHYPLRGGTVVNVVAVVEENEAAPGCRERLVDVRAIRPSSRRAFRPGTRPRGRLLAAAQDWRKWPLIDCDPLPGWTAGRVALLGDAAHPMVPFLAQGAAQAIEDAGALGEALRAARDVPDGLAAYAAARRARANRVQLQSRTQAASIICPAPPPFARDTALRALGGERMLARYDWLYGARRA